MLIFRNDTLDSSIDSVNLEISTCGYALIDKNGKVTEEELAKLEDDQELIVIECILDRAGNDDDGSKYGLIRIMKDLVGLHINENGKKDRNAIDNMVDQFEKTAYEQGISNLKNRTCLQGSTVYPLCELPGIILLPNDFNGTLEFWPFCSTSKKHKTVIECGAIECIRMRKYPLAWNSIEVYYTASDGAKMSLFLSFKREKHAANAKKILSKRCKEKRTTSIRQAQQQWLHGKLSNFMYLMILNDAAGRSFKNLSQYPIFPWILADYSSEKLDLTKESSFRDLRRPIAAISEEKASHGLEMHDALKSTGCDHPWMHGSHYSNPGGIVYFMFRKKPILMTKLQGGSFDLPDRMFNDMSKAWESVTSLWGNDVKEMIPEFYQTEDSSFLFNTSKTDFGRKTDGTHISDVRLPPWASDAEDFLSKMSLALESDHVSSNLHHWIDLIFGVHSRGRKAIKKNNIFYYMTYDEMYVHVESVNLSWRLCFQTLRAALLQLFKFAFILQS